MNQSIIDKIRKCLALSKSPNANEAATAIAKAHQLMKEHQVTEQDLAMSEVSEQVAPIGARRTPTTYLHQLAATVAKVFSCQLYYTQIGYRRGGAVFVGLGASPEIARYAFDVLRRKLEAARKEFLSDVTKRFKRSNRIARADQYCIGWVIGVQEACRKLVPPSDLPAVIQEYLNKNHELVNGNARPTRQVKSKSAAASWDRHAGYEEGKQVELHHGVSGTGYSGYLE